MFFFVIQQETVSSLLAYTPRRALSAAQVKAMQWKTDWCTVCMVQGKVGGLAYVWLSWLSGHSTYSSRHRPVTNSLGLLALHYVIGGGTTVYTHDKSDSLSDKSCRSNFRPFEQVILLWLNYTVSPRAVHITTMVVVVALKVKPMLEKMSTPTGYQAV